VTHLAESDGLKTVPIGSSKGAFWLLSRFRRRGGLGLPTLLRLRGRLDATALEAALGDLTDRHEALRSTQVFAGRQVSWVIAPPGTTRIALPLTDLTDSPASAEEQIRDLLCTDPDLRTSPVRAGLWRIGPDDHVLALNLHHMITDGWSNRVLQRDLAVLYNARRGGQPPALPPIATSFSEHEAAPATRPRREAVRDHLAPLIQGASIPELAPRVSREDNPRLNDSEWFDLGAVAAERLTAIAQAEDTTPSVILLTLFLSVLRAASGQDRVATCVVFSDRSQPELRDPELRDTVGYLSRSIVAPLTASGPTQAAIREVRDVVHAALTMPIPQMAVQQSTWDELGVGRTDEVMFHMFPRLSDLDGPAAIMDGLTVTPYRQPDGIGARFELQMMLTPTDDSLPGYVHYARDRFPRAFAAELVAAFEAAVAELTGSA
jgi:hypothetical protein